MALIARFRSQVMAEAMTYRAVPLRRIWPVEAHAFRRAKKCAIRGGFSRGASKGICQLRLF